MRRGRGRPSAEAIAEITPGIAAAVVEAYPDGAPLHVIAEVLGVTKQAVSLWEQSALASMKARARRSGLHMMERSEPDADFGEGGYTGPSHGPNRPREAQAVINAALRSEAMATCDATAGLMAQLDAIHERAKRASLVLGVMREDARWCEAWGDAAE